MPIEYIKGKRSMLSAFDVEVGDIITLDLVKDEHIFNIYVHSSTGVPKPWIRTPECQNLPEQCEEAFNGCYFTDATDISQEEMNKIIPKIEQLMGDPHYHTHEPNFVVHRLGSGERVVWGLSLEAIKPEGVLPINGVAVYACEGHTIQGEYKIRNGENKHTHAETSGRDWKGYTSRNKCRKTPQQGKNKEKLL
nr:uncharacterized protein LOC127323903 isoform X2 [Lolium perenne]